MKKTMGIIGFGRFGRFAATWLRDHFELSVFDTQDRSEEARLLDVRWGTLADAAKASIVLLCVPISRIGSTLREIVPHLEEKSLVVDTCSVKEYPVSLMERTLPPRVEILGTHPLFGPDSAAQSLQGRKIVLCPVRVGNLGSIENFLSNLGLKVLVRTPEEHDRGMASTQAIVQFLGRAFLEMGLTEQVMATLGYETLIKILGVVQHDTWELFHDLQTYNGFAGEIRQKLIESLIVVNRRLGEVSPPSDDSRNRGEKSESSISG